MVDPIELEPEDTLEVEGDTKSSARVLSAIKKAEDEFREFQDRCRQIDEVYDKVDVANFDGNWTDPTYDLFWSSMEILKPAIYAHPPQPAVAPMFSDRRPLQNTTAELLERVTCSAFDRACIDEVMLEVRDDLAFTNRGQMWATYESDEKGGGQRACIEHLDRTDFIHEPARKWADVGWVARRAWMTREQMRKRFSKKSKDAYKQAQIENRQNASDTGSVDNSRKAGVWEVWHKRDNRVYWVAKGCSVMLDEGEPHLKLKDFFPCPRPAYGTLQRRSLIPFPDYFRYAPHFNKINTLTARIYLMLDRIKMKGLIPAGGDIADAVEQALRSDDDELLIPVPSAALMQHGGNFVAWMPIKEIAESIQGLIAARGQLFEDFYQLSGISDIMRGATEAEETLGAQQLKSQYGSVRVRDKIEELQRIARDVARIVAEIAADKFSKETLLEMAQMEIPTKADLAKQTRAIEKAAEQELKGLAEGAKKAAQKMQETGQQVDPQEAEQALEQKKQQIVQKYAQQLDAIADKVPIEDVVELLRDDRARSFAFEIATDSTILTDEMQEKASRNEFLGVVTASSQALAGLAAMGEQGAALAGGLLKFATAPYRVGRELNKLIDDFVDAAPQMAAAMQGKQGGGEAEQAIAQANMKLAEAEVQKAQAAIAKVQADTQKSQQELQFKSADAAAKAQADQQRITLEMEQTRGNISETEARIQKIFADIQLAQQKLGIEAHREEREDVKTATDIQSRQVDQAMSMEDRQRQSIESERNAALGERQQSFTEQQSDRQQTFAERQAERESTSA